MTFAAIQGPLRRFSGLGGASVTLAAIQDLCGYSGGFAAIQWPLQRSNKLCGDSEIFAAIQGSLR